MKARVIITRFRKDSAECIVEIPDELLSGIGPFGLPVLFTTKAVEDECGHHLDFSKAEGKPHYEASFVRIINENE